MPLLKPPLKPLLRKPLLKPLLKPPRRKTMASVALSRLSLRIRNVPNVVKKNVNKGLRVFILRLFYPSDALRPPLRVLWQGCLVEVLRTMRLVRQVLH